MLTAFKNKVVRLLISYKKLTMVLSVFFVSGLIFFIFSDQALAVGESIARLISLFLEMLINFMGKLVLLLFNVLVGKLAPYNNFIDARAVQTGWVLTRDISNMFFILVLLAIAFGTILKIEQLNYQKVLPKLLIMAVVINFSKTICGLIIDFGQVVMLTFVNAFVAAAGGNFLNAFGLSRLLTLSESGSLEISDWNLTGAFLLALTMMTIALIVVVVFIIVLAYRIVMLWVLVILSPLAFLAGGFPVGKASQAYAQWWDNFTGAVIIGPILAFFLWLALLTAGSGTLSSEFPDYEAATSEQETFSGLGKTGENYFLTEGGTTDSMTSFIIATALLLAGLMVAQQTGGIVGQFAGSVAGKTKGFVGTALKGTAVGAGALLYRGAKGGAGWSDRQVRGRERVYGMLRRIPGLKGFGTDRMTKLREERGKRAAEAQARTRFLSPEELEKDAKAPAFTEDSKARKRAALKQTFVGKAYRMRLEDRGLNESQIVEDERQRMAELKSQSIAAHDVEKLEFVGDQYEKSPHLLETEEARRKTYREADYQAIQKMSPATRRQTEFLDEFVKRPDAEDFSKKIGGELRRTYLDYKSEYGTNFPGVGVYKGQGKFEPATADTSAVFDQMARTRKIDTAVHNRDDKIDTRGAAAITAGAGGDVYVSNIKQDIIKGIQAGGASRITNFDIKTGLYNQEAQVDPVAAKNTHAKILTDAVNNLKNLPLADPRHDEALKTMLGTDNTAILADKGTSGRNESREVYVDKIDGQSLAVMLADTAGTKDEGKTIQLIKDTVKALDTAVKEAGGTPRGTALRTKLQSIRSNMALRQHL